MKPILVVQNFPAAGAGRFSTLMSEHGIAQRTVLGNEADYDQLSSKDFSALVVLGGPQSAYQTEEYPYLLNEIVLCQDFLDKRKPIAAFCLGAQLLALAVGGEVVSGEYKEIGWYDLRLNSAAADDPLLADHPEALISYHFHGDCIRDVPGCTKLASSALTPIQLFRHGDNAYGFQYHAEIDGVLLERMCRNNREFLTACGVDPEALIDESRQHLPAFERHCRTILDRWLDLVASAD